MFSVNRIVALLTPVFGAAAAVGTAYVAKHFPGLPAIPASDVIALEVTGATAAVGAALKWLHGYQGFERLEHEAELAVKYIESQEKIKGVPSELDAQSWHEQVQNLQDQVTEATALRTRAEQGQATAEQKAGVALTQLANVKAALDRATTPQITPTVQAGVEQAQAVS